MVSFTIFTGFSDNCFTAWPDRRFSNSLTGGIEVAVRLQEDLSEASLLETLRLFLLQCFPTFRAGSGSPYSITTVS